MRKVTRHLRNEKGFGFIEYLIIFAIAFPIIMLLPDFTLWGANWIRANAIINETSQFMAEHGGANESTVSYLEARLAESGLDPAQWDLMISSGQKMKGEPLSIAVSSEYTFNSIKMLGVEFKLPMNASATVPSQLWVR